jgi:hypothetical protein
VDEVRNDEAHYGTLCGGVEEHFEKELERAGQQILPLGWGGWEKKHGEIDRGDRDEMRDRQTKRQILVDRGSGKDLPVEPSL